MSLAAGTPIGKYVVRRKLAEGGMAEIYLANSVGPEGFQKEVVIKRVRSFLAGDPEFVNMFIAEARLASRLEHPNVVQIFDFDKHEDTYYLAMEYVRGCSLWELRKRCREQGRAIPPVLVAHVGMLVARGLHYAHRLTVEGQALHLVHRDVTPQNVLLSLDGAVKLTDFGIAKAGNRLTAPGVLKGKFSYMSPEQARGEEVDARTDVFALGVVLWEMLTGGRLFDGDSEVAVLRSVQQSAIAPPVRLNPDVPEDLNTVVVRALQRDLAARFQTAGELERALGECVLRQARSMDDTDAGAFLGQILDGREEAPQPSAPPPREPTAVMPGAGSRGSRPDLPAVSSTPATPAAPVAEGDSVLYASTLVLPQRSDTGAQREPVPSDVAAAHTPPPAPGSLQAPASASAPSPSKRQGLPATMVVALASAALVAGAAVLMLSKRGVERPAQQPAPTAELQAARPAEPPALTPPAEDSLAAAAQPASATTASSGAPAAPGSSAQAAPAAPPQPAASSEAPTEARSKAPSREELARGTLELRAAPYADVLLNGKLLKRELMGRGTFSLAPGRYQVTFRHPSGSERHEVTIEPGRTVSRQFVAPSVR